jgi:hypothetical protein
MKNKFFTFIAFFFLSIAAYGQNNYEEVVYLKNGSIIHGMIVEWVPNVSIKIKSGENLFVYRLDEIEKLTKELVKSSGSGEGGHDFGFKPKGYTGNFEIGFVDYPDGDDLALVSFTMVNGYQFNPYFSMGLGVGGEISSQGFYNVPVFLDTKVYFTKTRFAPYFNFAVGYNVNFSDDYFYGSATSHGFLVNPSLGLRVALNKKLGLTTTLGYRYHGESVEGYYSNEFVSLHAVTLRWGILF